MRGGRIEINRFPTLPTTTVIASHKMDDMLGDVQDTLIQSQERVVRGATWFYRDFTCMFLTLLTFSFDC
jgi:hypothetical protein